AMRVKLPVALVRELTRNLERLSAAGMCRFYGTPFELYYALLARTWCEEVRHGVDACRVLAADPHAVLTGDYRRLSLEVHLLPDGRFRRELCGPTDLSPPIDEATDRSQQLACGTVREVSGQMTAAAGPCPHLMLLEWAQRIAFTRLEYAQGQTPSESRLRDTHEATARISVALLAEQFGWASPMPLQADSPADYERLHEWAAMLCRLGPNNLRLALKAIYQREFVHGRIDEPPFGEISEDGSWHPRPGPDPAGAATA
ncbi:MAG: hypothetical protein K2W96_12820, partial [Gemmataceae bacterium]|nr:hypothetical protein [Gemmataceae bacterium]